MPAVCGTTISRYSRCSISIGSSGGSGGRQQQEERELHPCTIRFIQTVPAAVSDMRLLVVCWRCCWYVLMMSCSFWAESKGVGQVGMACRLSTGPAQSAVASAICIRC
jgi:hypothetical protein